MTTVHSGSRTHSPWTVLAVLSVGLFMTLLDLTIVNIAIPQISDTLHASLDEILWVLNSYTLIYAALLLTCGRLGDLLGPRQMFAAGIAVFTLASAGSGLAATSLELIIARGGQGLGAAILAPQVVALVSSLFPPDKRGAAYGVTGALGGLAVIAGPTLGGFIVTQWSWRGVFFLNVPIGIAAVICTLRIVPDVRRSRGRRLDLLGVALATSGMFALVFAGIEGQRFSWGSVWGALRIWHIAGAGAILLILFLLHERRRQAAGSPLLPFAVFRDRNYALMSVVLAAMGFALLGILLPLTIYFQSVLGMSALQAGLTFAPMSILSMIAAPISGGLSERYGGKYFLIAGLLLLGGGMLYIDGVASVAGGALRFLPGMIVAGLGMGCVWAPVYNVAMRDVSEELAGVASGVLATVQEFGGVLATASVGALLQNRLALSLHNQAVHYSVGLPHRVAQQFVASFSDAAQGGLAVGAGQTGGSAVATPGTQPQISTAIVHLASVVFRNAYVVAMRPTLLLPIAVLVLAAASTAALRRVHRTVPRVEESPQTRAGLAR